MISNLAVIKNQQVSGALTIQSMDDLARLADMMSKSGFFEDSKSAAQAGVKILCGLELGIPAFSSMVGIHLIKGKPAIGASIMAAMVKKSGKYNYRVLEHTDQVCRIAFLEGREEIGISEFTAADAAKMGTQNMNRFPKNMLFARAISNGVKFYCPDLFLGAPVYTPDELGAEVDQDGEVISVASAPAVPAPTAHAVPAVALTDETTMARLMDVQQRTGQSSAQLWTIAAKQKPPINPDAMSPGEFIMLRDALYAAWGSEQPGAFKARKHAWNAYQGLLKNLEPEASDQEIWEAWEMEVVQRINAASAPDVAEEF